MDRLNRGEGKVAFHYLEQCVPMIIKGWKNLHSAQGRGNLEGFCPMLCSEAVYA